MGELSGAVAGMPELAGELPAPLQAENKKSAAATLIAAVACI
jgi:hypothetical protein